MADKATNVVLNFKMDGQVEYADTLKQINSVMNTAAKEYKNHISAMGKDASATDKLRAEKKKLEIQMEGAQKRTKMLSDEYEEMAKDSNTSTKELTKMYGKLLDAEKAESSLQKSLDRVNDGLTDQAQEARDAQDSLDKLKSESKVLDSEQKNLTSSFKLQNAELSDNATEAEKVELAQKQLESQTKLTERTIANLEQQLEETKKVYGDNSVEVNNLESKINDARTTLNKFEGSLEDVEGATDEAGDGLQDLGSKMDLNNLLEATEMLQGVADKLLEVGSAAFDAAQQVGDAQTDLQANLGLTEKEAESMGDVVDDIYRNGVVGSMDEAAQSVIDVKQTFKDLNDVELEDVTDKITTFAKRTDTDVKENVRAADQLMNAFGVTGDEAMDLIAAGFQDGLNRSDDFLDTLNEFSPHFETAGFKADEMLQIIKNGMENGAMNTDKAADAVKEFQVKLGDGSIEKSIETYSKDTQGMFQKWEDGKATTADVANSISKDLKKMSPNEQQKAISELASQFEDLGVDGAAALFNVGDAFKDVNKKADEMAKKSPGEKWESSLRELEKSLVPVGENLTDAFMPFLDVLSKIGKKFSELPAPVQTFITVFGALIALAGVATPVIIALAVAIGALEVSLLPIILVVAAIAAAIAGIIVIIQNWGAITDWLSKKWNQTVAMFKVVFALIKSIFNKALNWIDEKTGGKFKSVTDAIRKYMDMAWSNIKRVWQFIKDSFSNATKFVKSLVTGDFEGMWQAVKDQMGNIEGTVKDIWDNVMGFFRGINLWEIGKDILSGFIDGFKSLDIPTPHFSVTGDLDLNPVGGVSVPKVGVDWYAKGGIFTQPTIFGASGGNLKGAGEAGPEAALPLNKQTLGDIGKGIADTMGGDSKVEVVVYLDTDEVNTKLAPGMSKQLNDSNKMKARNQGVIIQ